MASIEEKLCKTCNRVLPKNTDYFCFNGKYFLGPCRDCARERTRQWVKNNKDRKREIDKRYNEENAEILREKRRIYYLKNSDKIKERAKKWESENRDRVNERDRKRRREKGDSYREYQRKWQEAKRSDPLYRFNSAIRCSVRRTMRGIEGSLRHLPYTRDELREHIERQFTKGMTWENYGSFWHVDHIIPVSSFNITGPECDDFKACWALTNLRPLKAEENLSKGDRVTHLI